MGAQGTANLDFGTFPGKSDASIAVTGQAAILGSSIAEAWIFPTATADHTVDEHMVETLKVIAANIVAGTGFTIYGFNTSQVNEPLTFSGVSKFRSAATSVYGDTAPSVGGIGTRIYGIWKIGWVWN